MLITRNSQINFQDNPPFCVKAQNDKPMYHEVVPPLNYAEIKIIAKKELTRDTFESSYFLRRVMEKLLQPFTILNF